MCTDENGADFMQVAIRSLFVNHIEETIDLHIITDGLSRQVVQQLEELTKQSINHKISIHNIDPSKYGDVNGCGDGMRFPKATCFRFEIPKIINNYEKVIYLDTDVIVETSLSDLYNLNMEGFGVAAVRNCGERTTQSEYIFSKLNFKSQQYFNAGVLLMNLIYFREQHIVEQSIEYISNPNNPNKFPDQDALNVILRGKVKYIPAKYNLQGHHFWRFENGEMDNTPEIIEAREHPVIIHYTSFKPWQITGIPSLPFLKSRFEFYRHMKPEIKVKKRRWDNNVERRFIYYWLWKMGIVKRKPVLLTM